MKAIAALGLAGIVAVEIGALVEGVPWHHLLIANGALAIFAAIMWAVAVAENLS